MGQEIQCRLRFQGRLYTGKALLETNEIVFRGDLRLKIPRARITEVSAEAGQLSVNFDQGLAIFELGDAAPKWANKILNPPSRAAKFGLKSETTFTIVGQVDADFLQEIRSAGAKEGQNAEVVFLAAADRDALQDLRPLRGRTVWVIYPKGLKTITETDVISAGRQAGMVDIKVVGFSGTHTALKFVPAVQKI